MPQSVQPPVIVVPGITATSLRDQYPVDPERVWTPLSRDFERICLHPQDPRYERVEPARIRTDDVFNIVYSEIIEELRHNLSPAKDRPTPVFPFPYDWRQPLASTQSELLAFIDEVIDRTLLLRHYANTEWAQNPQVDLVGHSMGGLIIAGLLATALRQPPVRKVATLGTPFRGSFESVLKIQTGMADLGTGDSGSREREAARLMPGLYHLLPNIEGRIRRNDNAATPLSLFTTTSWQSSVIDTIASYFKLYGTRPRPDEAAAKLQDRRDAELLFTRLLSDAKAHRDTIETLKLNTTSITKDAWLCIAGVDVTTRIELTIGTDDDPDRFDLKTGRDNKYQDSNPEKSERTGDGTVPFLGATPPFLERERMVCVTPDDFSYWEIGDRVMASDGLVGFHGQLPNMDLIHRLVISHFKGEPQGDIWGRLPPGVDEAAWRAAHPGLTLKD